MRFPKPLRRVDDKHTARLAAARAWKVCCAAVDTRDQFRCRVCRRHLRRTLELCPERAEHHHLVPRSLLPKALHTDPRAVVLVCQTCHDKLTRHELVAIGSTAWVVDGTPYLDASGEVRFVPAQSAI